MTREETKKILMVVQAAYPNYSVPDKITAIDTWFRFLGEYTYTQVDAAVGTYIRSDTSGFAPTIGQVVEKLQMLFQKDSLNEMEAWNLAYKAICNSNYHADEEFEKLPELVQKAVVNPGQLREWGQMDVETVNSVIQSNFMRTYRAEMTREKEKKKLGRDVIALVQEAKPWEKLVRGGDKLLSVGEERKLAERNAVPFPEKLRASFERLMEVDA